MKRMVQVLRGRSKRVLIAVVAALTLVAVAPLTGLGWFAPESALAARCNQSSRAFLDSKPGLPNVVQGERIFLAGIAAPGTSIEFLFYGPDGRLLASQHTSRAGSNCVVNHTRNPFNTGVLPLGVARIAANIVAWENGRPFTQEVGVLNVIAPPPPPPCDDLNGNGICDRDEQPDPQPCLPGRICLEL